MPQNKFLSRDNTNSDAIHKKTMVWQWLQHADAGTDEIGYVIKAMRKRVDMVDKFPHKTYLLNYLTERCKIDVPVAVRVLDRLWNMYAGYRDSTKHSQRIITSAPLSTTRPADPDDKIPVLKSDQQWLSR